MDISGTLLSMFSARIEERDGRPTIVIPEQELELGPLNRGASYRVAVLSEGDRGRKVKDDATRDAGSHGHEGPAPPVEEGEIRKVEIEDVGEQGDGLARVDRGYIVFVPDTKIGDRVSVEITDTRANYAFAEVHEEEPVAG